MKKYNEICATYGHVIADEFKRLIEKHLYHDRIKCTIIKSYLLIIYIKIFLLLRLSLVNFKILFNYNLIIFSIFNLSILPFIVFVIFCIFHYLKFYFKLLFKNDLE